MGVAEEVSVVGVTRVLRWCDGHGVCVCCV